MSDPITREEFAARLEAIEARSDTKFERISGEIAAVKAASIGRGTFLLGLLALFGAIIAVLALGGDRFSAGMSVADVARSAAREAVAEAAKGP